MRTPIHVSRRSRLLLAVALTAILSVTTSLVASAVLTSDPGPFTGCLGVKTNKGLVYNVAAGSAPYAPCSRGDLQIEFSNAAGPQGEPGPQGPAGPQGEQGLPGDPGDLSAVTDAIDALEARIAALEAVVAGGIDADGDGYTAENGDCDDAAPAIHPGATEVTDNAVDDDCDGLVDESIGPDPNDMDSDGVPNLSDNCPSVPNPTQEDADLDLLGDACDPTPNGEGGDADADSFTVANGDCDDSNPTVYPGAPEMLDGLDNDCDGQLLSRTAYSGPQGTAGYGICQAGFQFEAEGGGWGPIIGEVTPSVEVENGIDDDCNGIVDDLG